MKKIYTLIAAVTFSAASFAQPDISVGLDAVSGTSSADPLDMSFTITNDGADIPIGDSVAFAVVDMALTNFWCVDDLAPGCYNFIELTAPFAASGPIPIPVFGGAITMDWMYTNFGLVGDICALVWVQDGTAASSLDDATPLDNIECVTYTVTSVTDIADIALEVGNVYAFENQLKIENKLSSDIPNVNVTITNIAGQIVQDENLTLNSGVNQIDLEESSKGIYLVSITANGLTTTKKVAIH